MPRYNFIFERGSVTVQADTLALASFMVDRPDLGKLTFVECGTGRDPDPDMTFEHYTEDLCLLVEADARAGTKGSWDEPSEPSMVWTYRVWYNTQHDGSGQWVSMPLTSLKPTVIDFLNDEANERYLSDLDEDDGPDRIEDD